jgi:hypothetical protein
MKRVITTLLILSIIINSFSGIVYGNVQIPVDSVTIDNVFYVVGENIITGKPMISPTITASWNDPSSWASDPNGNIHSPDYYTITVNNKTLSKTNDIRVDKGSDEFNNKLIEIDKKINLDTGSLYEVVVQPYHYHTLSNGTTELAPLVGTPKKAYAITDLQVDLESDENSIKITWDDIGFSDMKYRIVYAMGDYTNRSKEELIDNKEGEITGITSDSDDVDKFYDDNVKRNKLSYTLNNNINPGQVYSIMIEPLVDYYEGNVIVRNRNTPFIKSTSTNINLTVVEEGDYIRLEWSVPPSFKVGQTKEEYSLVEGIIYEYRGGKQNNIAIFNDKAAIIGYYKIPKPLWETEYQIVLTYKAVSDAAKPPIKPESNKVAYIPSQLAIKPTKPKIPKPISQNIVDTLLPGDDISQYLVEGHSYNDDFDDLLSKNITFHYNDKSNIINFVWSAFRRLDINKTSSTYNQTITDTNVYYDIWVTDSLSSLGSATRVAEDLRYGSSSTDNIIKASDDTILGYKYSLDQYYNEEKGTLENIMSNKMYYIKVVAKKKTSNGYLSSYPTIVSIYFTDDGAVYNPPVLAKPPLEVKDTNKNDVTIGWKERWEEEIAPGIFRTIDLGKDKFGVSDVKYKFHAIPYEDVQKELTERSITFEEYYEELINNDKDGLKKIPWKDVTPDVNDMDPNILTYMEDGLDMNTSYLFILYPYRVLNNGDELFSHYPTPIVVSTEPDDSVVNPDPIVPNLYMKDEYRTDTTLGVTWKYDTNFTYELKYSTYEEVESAETVEWTLPDDPLDPKYPQDGKFYDVEIKNLFPDSTYYFWIRAKSNGKESAWSNAVAGRTNDIGIPNPPRGLGVASKYSIQKHDLEKSVTEDYIVVEWIKDIDDVEASEGESSEDNEVKKEYSYIVEFSDNSKFIDPIYVVSGGGDGDGAAGNVEILEKNLIKFNDLIGNRKYYIKVKTKVTVTGSKDNQKIEKESGYSEAITVITLSNGDEYDSNTDPELEILPESDYEIIYDSHKDELKFRFRDNSKDEDGKADNNVDQRFISKLVSKNIYEYEIDVSRYHSKPIDNRKIEIPYSVMEALDEYKVGLKIIGEDVIINIPYKSFNTQLTKQVDRFGVAPKTIINIEEYSKKYPKNATISLGVPQNISISLISKRGNIPLYYTDKDMTISLMIDEYYNDYNTDTVTYGYAKDSKDGWTRLSSKYNKSEEEMTFKTAKLGLYGVFLQDNAIRMGNINDSSHWSESARYNVLQKYDIEGFNNYYANNNISEPELINIIFGMYHIKTQ